MAGMFLLLFYEVIRLREMVEVLEGLRGPRERIAVWLSVGPYYFGLESCSAL